MICSWKMQLWVCGARFRPQGLRFRPVGLRFRLVGLRFRPVGLRFRLVGLRFRPQGLRSSVFVFDTSVTCYLKVCTTAIFELFRNFNNTFISLNKTKVNFLVRLSFQVVNRRSSSERRRVLLDNR